MKRIFGGFDHFWSLHESASHATLSASHCQQASSFHQIVGRPSMIRVDVSSISHTENNEKDCRGGEGAKKMREW